MQNICIVGLGYVGLPLAYVFAKAGHAVSGYDVSAQRISELLKGEDRTNELTKEDLTSVTIDYQNDPAIISGADIVIIAVPTPIDSQNKPDLSIIDSATEAVGTHFKDGAIIVYESTVYPGVTQERCRPILEKESGGKTFTLGYSPERVNPGDKEHTIDKIVKVVAGEDEETLETLAKLYETIITAGVHRAPSIKVAEMAKAIENAQRDLNIAYVNEIAKLCNAIGISTKDVLDAAKTKWNFLPFEPGLVGGHCIGVDPYYLVEKAKQLGIGTNVIAAGRSVNDGMAKYIVETVLASLACPVVDRSRTTGAPSPLGRGLGRGGQSSFHILLLGLTFKPNVPDTRNSKSQEVVKLLEERGCIVTTHDPYHSESSFQLPASSFDAILLLVPHKEYIEIPAEKYAASLKENSLFFDLKSIFSKEDFEDTGKKYLSL